MEEVFYGFAGDNVEITRSEKRTHTMPFLNYEISSALRFLSVEEKYKVVRYIIKISRKPELFDAALRNLKGKEKEQLLARCEEQEKRLPKDYSFVIY